ncbi:hypothetical protein GCM10022409_26470 [Hymenobacter glaciei]|uniref:SUKH-3 domain containing protein n=1 Tax=Hymenobacter glaciei TaxID=877209 RepID=A0ABP7UB07_9BACT
MSNQIFYNHEVIALLKEAGWFEGRNAGSSLTLPSDVKYPVEILEILQEFGGLSVRSSGPGITLIKNDIDFNPAEAEFESEIDGRLHYYSQLLKRTIYPIGYVPNESLMLCLDSTGKTYMAGDNLYLVGTSFVDGVSNILLGIRGKIFHEDDLRWMD